MNKPDTAICGIVMPISKFDDLHDEGHWLQVKEVISRAIEDAGCSPKAVWEGSAHDIIQSEILKNLFENEIVVCDMSTLNPNVMLEVGMRLTTKKPTLLIAEKGTSLPFDTGIIHTEFYDKSLQWAGVAKFIEALSSQIQSKRQAVKNGTYKPYMEAFEFETVEPPKKSVSSVEHLTDIVADTNRSVAKLEKLILSQSSGIIHRSRVQPDRDDTQGDSLSDWRIVGKHFIQPNLDGFSNENHGRQKEVESSKVGRWVHHKKFGIGQILEVDEDRLMIDFDGRIKPVMDAFVEYL